MPKSPDDMSEGAIAKRAALSEEAKVAEAKKAAAAAKHVPKPVIARKR